MPTDWSELSALKARGSYDATVADLHYGATEPMEPRPCRCDPPGLMLDPDDGEQRCWKCGARPADAASRRP